MRWYEKLLFVDYFITSFFEVAVENLEMARLVDFNIFFAISDNTCLKKLNSYGDNIEATRERQTRGNILKTRCS